MVPWGKGGSRTSRPRPQAPDFGLDSEGHTSEDSSDEDLAMVQQCLDHPTDEMAWRLADHQERLSEKIGQLRRRKEDLRKTLTHYQKKEIEFVTQMDSHMDEVERTERQLNERIEGLTADNEGLRCDNDARAGENEKLLEKLDETAKHCEESETRVHFLMDRLVALLSASCTDPSQMEKVTLMLERERETLRHLKDARQQLDEVRQRNNELGDRLREEQGLSRRLRDQLHEAEKMLKNGDAEKIAKPLDEKPMRNGVESSGISGTHPGASTENGRPGISSSGRLPVTVRPAEYRPYAGRTDQGEARLDNGLKVKKPFQETSEKLIKGPAERSPLGELPPPISEADEPREALSRDRSPPRTENLATWSGSEGDTSFRDGCNVAVVPNKEVTDHWAVPPMPERQRCQAAHSQRQPTTLPMTPGDLAKVDAVREAAARRLSPPSSPGHSAVQSQNVGAVSPKTTPPKSTFAGQAPAPQKSSTVPPQPASAGPAQVLSMEQKLRDALDAASFECPVVRVGSGVYSFGPLRAKVQLNAEGEVVASREDGRLLPISEFIRAVSLSARDQQPPPATSSAAPQAQPMPAAQYTDPLPSAVSGVQSHAPAAKAPTQRAASSPPSTNTAPPGQGLGMDLGVPVPPGTGQPQQMPQLRPFPGTTPGPVERVPTPPPPQAHEQRRPQGPSVQGPSVYQTREQAQLVSSARTASAQGAGTLHTASRTHSPGPPPGWRDPNPRPFMQDHASPISSVALGPIRTAQGQSSTPPPERFRPAQSSPPPTRQSLPPQGIMGPPVSNPRLLLAANGGPAVAQNGAVRMGATLSPGRRIQQGPHSSGMHFTM